MVGTQETGQLRASCGGGRGRGRPALLSPSESARWDRKILNPERVSVVPGKTLVKVLVCGTGTSPLRFPGCHVPRTPAEGGALGVSVGLTVGRKH